MTNQLATPSLQWTELFTSVADVWFIWLGALLVLGGMTRQALLTPAWSGVRAFSRDERGASYALSYLLTFPAYLLLVCLMLQATLILMAKMGTVYAAYAAARTAIVWQPSQAERSSQTDDRSEFTQSRARRAAAMAITPFASGFSEHLNDFDPSAYTSLLDAGLYTTMYNRSAENAASRSESEHIYLLDRFDPDAIARDGYVLNKARYAATATEVEIGGEATDGVVPWNEEVPVRVTHTMAIQVPIMGRVFGQQRSLFFSGPFVREISTTATLPSEAAETDSGRLNIPYDPRELVGIEFLQGLLQ